MDRPVRVNARTKSSRFRRRNGLSLNVD